MSYTTIKVTKIDLENVSSSRRKEKIEKLAKTNKSAADSLSNVNWNDVVKYTVSESLQKVAKDTGGKFVETAKFNFDIPSGELIGFTDSGRSKIGAVMSSDGSVKMFEYHNIDYDDDDSYNRRHKHNMIELFDNSYRQKSLENIASIVNHNSTKVELKSDDSGRVEVDVEDNSEDNCKKSTDLVDTLMDLMSLKSSGDRVPKPKQPDTGCSRMKVKV